MLKLKLIGTALIASVLATAIVVDTADARRGGGGGGGMRAGGGGFGGGGMRASGLGGGGMRAASFNRGGAIAGNRGGSFNRVSNPIRTADIGRPGRPDVGLPGRPGNRPDWGNRPGWGWGGGWNGGYWGNSGWGWGAAAVGAGLAYGAASSFCDPNYDPYCSGGYASYGYAPGAYGAYGYAPMSSGAAYGSADAVAECARRFRSYDPASQTYLAYNGQRIQCPQ
jgi:BA14K-like protein